HRTDSGTSRDALPCLDANDSLVRRISRSPRTFTRQVMNLRRILRSPLAWIVLAVIAIGLLIDFSQRVTSGYKEAPTSQVVPFIIIGVLFFFLLNSVQGGGSRVMQFGKSKAKIANKDTPKTTFRDVAGCDEAIEELEEIKEFLAEPAKFQAVGAKIPKGVLLY